MDPLKWVSALKNIYGVPGKSYDGYVTTIGSSESYDSLIISCYTVEGPEDTERLAELKSNQANWSLYRKSAVVNSILSYALHLGMKVGGYEVEELIPI
jgi:hypothetical protein